LTIPSDPVQHCEVDFNVDDSAKSLGAFLERIQSTVTWLEQRSSAVSPLIDMDRCRYLGPDAVALLAALVYEARITNRSLRIRLPSGPESLLGFCRFSGLGALVGSFEESDEAHPECETIAVRRCRGVPGLESERIIDLIRRHDSMHEDEAE